MKYTSEAVGKGHPDKLSDYISDSILTYCLKEDRNSRVAIETAVKNDLIYCFGEISTTAKLDYEKIILEAARNAGYEEDFNVQLNITEQSKEIDDLVSKKEMMAGDQGIMFAYATNKTPNYMPLAFNLAQTVVRELNNLAKNNPLIKTDCKAQVTLDNDKIDRLIIAICHDEALKIEDLRKIILDEIIEKKIDSKLFKKKLEDAVFINRAGPFTKGGPWADAGLTGRKIVCDSYGGEAVGGGAFSGKDPSKVDRSGAYYARFVAKNIVMHDLADECLIQVAYVIGESQPVSLNIDCRGSEKIPLKRIYDWVNDNFDFRVQNIIDELNLLEVDYRELSNYGHFGKDNFSWEAKKDIS